MFRFVFGWLLGLLPVVLLAADPASPATAMPADAGDTTTPSGEYCPGEESMYLVLEELTVAMEGVSRARESLLVLDDAPAAGMLLARADAALALAVGRGSGARVASLIDAMLAAKKDGHPKATLIWFPVLKQAVAGLPDDAAREAANAWIVRAEGILEGRARGDEVEVLLKAKQMLLCDPLHIPLHQSLTHLERLQRDIARGAKPSDNAFSVLVDLLNRAMSYGLQRLIDLRRT
jgi:hypothetical protein